jgi:hypothetical protein
MRIWIASLLLITGSANAQITLFTDSMGLPLGSATQVGNTTFYNDALGLPLGTAQNMGNTTIYSNSLGLPMGSSTTMPQLPLYSNPVNSSPSSLSSPFFPSNSRSFPQ